MARSIVTYETFHGSAKKAAQIIAEKLGTKCVNIDTPFEVEDLSAFDQIILCFNFRGPYTAQFTKLYLSRVKDQFKDKAVFLVGEGLFSEKEFPVVAEEIHKLIPCRSFRTWFVRGQLRMGTLSPEEQALLGKFMELTGMKLQDMGEFDEARAQAVAEEIADLVAADDYVAPQPEETAPESNIKWVCPLCGYVHTGPTPPEKCPLCGVPGEKFTRQE